MADLLHNYFESIIDANSAVRVGAKLWSYADGTSTELATYTDNGLTTPHTNPIIADSEGRFEPIYLLPEGYKFRLLDANDNLIEELDPYTPVTALLAGTINQKTLSVDIEGLLTNSQELYEMIGWGGTTLTLPAGAGDSRASSDTAATAQTVLTLLKNGSSVGTVTFAAGGTSGVYAVASDVTIVSGDKFGIQNQGTADVTLADVHLSIVFTAS